MLVVRVLVAAGLGLLATACDNEPEERATLSELAAKHGFIEFSAPPELRALNRLEMRSDGLLSWNGASVELPELRQLGQEAAQLDPAPALVVDVHSQVPVDEIAKVLPMLSENFGCGVATTCYYDTE